MTTPVIPLEDLRAEQSVLFTVEEPGGRLQEVLLLLVAEDEVVAWRNFCQHEIDQPLDPGDGPIVREDVIVCPKHASTFDVRTGRSGHGPAAGTSLSPVSVAIEDEQVVLDDDRVQFHHRGGIDADDDMPSSTSHLRF